MVQSLLRFSTAAAALLSVSAVTPPLVHREGGGESSTTTLTIPLLKRTPRTLAADDDGAWAAELGRKLISKYTPTTQTLSKRGQGFNLLTNQVRIEHITK